MTQYTILERIGKGISRGGAGQAARKGKGLQGLKGDQNLTVTAPEIV
jgi:hypothetical protein